MKTKRVIVFPYDKAWKDNFNTIRGELAAALGDLTLRIEHVGSTSVPGLSAKPIIDIDVVIRDYSVFPEAAEALERIGYWHEAFLEKERKEWSCRICAGAGAFDGQSLAG